MELKDQYTLKELSKILSPEVADKNIKIEDLSKITEVNPQLIDTFRQGYDKDNFSYIEVIIMIAISELKKEKNITSEQIIGLIRGMNVFLDRIKSTSYLLVILDQNSNYYANLYQEQAQVFMDSRFTVVKEIRLDEISNQIKIKYQNKYNFLFDEVNNED